jgi:hypothetical protein
MKRAISLFATAGLLALTFLPVQAQAQEVKKINLTNLAPQNFSPVPKKADPTNKSTWICGMFSGPAPGWCFFGLPAYIGAPCQCCGPLGCFPGSVSAFSSVDHPEKVTSQNQ